MLSRRKMLGNTIKLSAGMVLAPAAVGIAANDQPLELRLGKGIPAKLPSNFTGLGYEMSSVASIGLLSPANSPYVELIRGLGPDGVLRVGGIVANYTRYVPGGTVKAEREDTVITRASLAEFGAFLDKIGWSAIWSVNFAQGSIAEAVEEAQAVHSVLGTRLMGLELGNEVD